MVHKCSSSKLPTIQVLRHKLFPEQEKHDFTQTRKHEKYQSSGAGGTRSPPAMPHRLQHLPAHFIQNGRWGLGIGQTLGYWTLRSTFAK